jgi:hypothetical protein
VKNLLDFHPLLVSVETPNRTKYVAVLKFIPVHLSGIELWRLEVLMMVTEEDVVRVL